MLTKAQQELLDAIKTGVDVQWTPSTFDSKGYWFRKDTGKTVTQAAKRLVEVGAVNAVELPHRCFRLTVQ